MLQRFALSSKRLVIPAILLILLPTTVITNTTAQTTKNQSMIPQYDSSSRNIQVLSESKIQEALKELPGWSHQNNRLTKTYNCGSFSNAVSFIVAFSYKCEATDHHPEIFNVYSKVRIEMTTYDVGKKVSHLDLQLAKHIEEAAIARGCPTSC